MVDWGALLEGWDKVPEEEKKRIAELFKKKTREQLAALFREDAMAGYVYEEAVGEPVTVANVKVRVDAAADVGEWFGELYYDDWVPAFFGSPSMEALKTTLEVQEVEIDKASDLTQAGFDPKELEEELKTYPWPFNTGMMIVCRWKYPEDVEFTEKGKEQWDIYYRTYRREDLELMSIDELKRILRIKRLSTAGKKEELISRILGVPYKPPEVAPPVAPPTAPPPKPPAKPPVPLVPEKGLAKADEKRLLTRFESLLLERTITPARWRPMFDDKLYEWRDAFQDLSRDEALSRGFSAVERLVGDIVELAKPPVKPPLAPPVRPPEEVPAVPPVLIAPPVAPPPRVMREWGMPWSYFTCPACLGEGVETLVLRSPYLESRLIYLGLPTRDSLFFELCEEHKRKYGGAFEHFPRDTIEFWVGEAVSKAEIDIAVLVGLGISNDYVLNCVRFYQENKAKAVQ